MFYVQKTIENNWSLRDVNKPIGVSEYQITEDLPGQSKSSSPRIEPIEGELGKLAIEEE